MRNIYSGCVQTKLISKISWNVNTLLNLHFSDIVSLVVLTLHCHELEILKISLYFQGSYNEDQLCCHSLRVGLGFFSLAVCVLPVSDS